MKKTLVVVVLAIVIGGSLAYFILSRSDQKISNDNDTCYAFQIGAYENYENANRIAERNNGIVVKSDKLYLVYVAILKDKEAILILSSYYDEIGLNYYLKEIEVSKDFVSNINDDEVMIRKSNKETYTTINLDVLQKYLESI